MYEHTKSICHVLAYINIPEVSPSIKELWPLFHCVTPTRTTLHCIGFGLGSDREAPRHEESLIMSHISGGIESTHPKTHIQQHTYTKGKQDGCFQWLRFNWKLRFILDRSKMMCSPTAEGRTGQETFHHSLPHTSPHYLQHLFEPKMTCLLSVIGLGTHLLCHLRFSTV